MTAVAHGVVYANADISCSGYIVRPITFFSGATRCRAVRGNMQLLRLSVIDIRKWH